ncbi:PE_PGRS family protein [Mycobacterium marinum str. Europe]|nr:PE_PGRS family protein [Mycobacterium marinum str. Europe]
MGSVWRMAATAAPVVGPPVPVESAGPAAMVARGRRRSSAPTAAVPAETVEPPSGRVGWAATAVRAGPPSGLGVGIGGAGGHGGAAPTGNGGSGGAGGGGLGLIGAGGNGGDAGAGVAAADGGDGGNAGLVINGTYEASPYGNGGNGGNGVNGGSGGKGGSAGQVGGTPGQNGSP